MEKLATYICVILDASLSWGTRIKQIINKFNYSYHYLHHLLWSNLLSMQNLILLAMTLLPALSYAASVWAFL